MECRINTTKLHRLRIKMFWIRQSKSIYGLCLDKGPCTADGRSLRRILPETMATNCEKYNAKQKQTARKLSSHLKEHRPEIWATFVERYDPNKRYVTTFEKFLTQTEK